MNETALQTIESVNLRFAILLAEARRCLRGEGEFSVENVRGLRAVIEEMAPIVTHSSELRRTEPAIGALLDVYKSHLRELQATLVQVRVALQLQQARLQSSQSQNVAVSRWASALQQTR